MTQTQLSPSQMFSHVLLDALTSPGIIASALPIHSSEDIYFAIAGIAFSEWLCRNYYEDTDCTADHFFSQVYPIRFLALSVIHNRMRIPHANEPLH